MNKIKSFVLAAIGWLCCISMSAEDFEVDGIYYNIISSTDKTVEVTYRGTYCDSYSNEYSGAVSIPESVTYNSCTYDVTSIGHEAFSFCSGLTSVEIPNSVASIGKYAFYGCSSLTSVEIPNSVTSIGDQAFQGCTNLKMVLNRSDLTFTKGSDAHGSIAYYADMVFNKYDGCIDDFIFVKDNDIYYLQAYVGSEKKLVLPENYKDSNYVIAASVFEGCSSLTSVVIPNSVTSIGDQAFSRCSGLTSVEIGNSVTSIGEAAFSGTTNLSSIIVDENNAYYDSRGNCNAIIETASNTLIAGCKNTIIPSSVISIGDYAFYFSGLTSVEIPNGVKSIGRWAFCAPSLINSSVTIPSSVTTIEEYAFADIYPLTSVHIEDIAAWCKIKFGNESSNPLLHAKNLYLNGEKLTELVIPNSVTSIGDYAFYAHSGLTSVEIPNSVTSIGERAFASCSGLTSVIIEDLAAWCKIKFEDSFANPLYYAKSLYLKDEKVTELIIPEGVTSIGEYAFRGCSGLTSVEIPNSVTSIGYQAFEDCSGLTSVEIPNSVTSIESYAFTGCSGLTSVEIPNSVTSIGYEAFYGCSGLTSVEIPNSVNSIGFQAFADCSGLTSVVIGNGVTSFGDQAFYGCSGLTSVVIGNGVTSFGSSAFNGCSSLTSVVIPNSVTSIGKYAFHGCSSLTSVEIPNSVTSIGWEAFSGCSGLTSVEIGNSVSSIESFAFYGCDNLKSITFLNPTPPAILRSTFSNYDATLYVPFGAKAAYSEAEYWKNFTNIEELAPSHYELKDGVVYDQMTDKQVDAITYTRTLPNLYWNALYVPFELPYDVIADRYDVAYINDVNGYDTDDNGTIDDLAMEIIKIKGGTLKANYPYLIKAKTAADRTMSITVEDATLYAAAENSVDCSSVYQNYAVTGIYTKKTAEELAGKLAISTSGAWQPLAAGTALNPFRLYLSIENRDNSPLKVESSAMSRMRIVERGETTGVETITPAQQREDVIIDLSGRRVKQPVKGGVYIINGKKRIF